MSRRTLWLFSFLCALTALRLVIAAHGPLAPDEAYYTMWSQRMDWSFFSKGPGVAAVIHLGTKLFGLNELGVRFFSPLFGLGTSLLVFSMARRLFNEQSGIWAVLLLNATPIFNAGSVLMTIDPISIFFWAAALAAFWRALEASPRFSLWWPLTGLCVGLGFLAKYTNAIFLVSVLLVLLSCRRYHSELARPGLYLLLTVFALCTTPVIYWNASNHWVTVSHLRARGALDSAFTINPLELLEFTGLHLGVYSPLLFAGIIVAIVWALPLARRKFEIFYLLAFGLPLLVMYGILSLKETGEANWTAPAFVSLGIMAAGLWLRRSRHSANLRRYALAAFTLGILMSLLLLNTDLARMAGIPWPYDRDPTGRLRGWETAAREVHRIRTELEAVANDKVFLIGDSYGTAAALSFHLPEPRVEGPNHPPVYIPESQNIENQFSFWPRYDEFLLDGQPVEPNPYFTEQRGVNPFLGRNALYITVDPRRDSPPSSIRDGFESHEMIALIEIKRRGQIARTLRIFLCRNYLTQSL